MIKSMQFTPECQLVDVFQPDETEKKHLQKHYGMTDEMFGYAFDIDERARIESADDTPLTLIVYDVVVSKDSDGEKDPTAPITFALDGETLVIFSAPINRFVVEQLLLEQTKLQAKHATALQVMLHVMYKLSGRYFDVIHAIDKRRQHLQKNLKIKTSRDSITQLMDLQTNLVYYLTSLRSNTSVVADMSYSRNFQVSEADKELIDDINVELRQGLEMAQMASEVIAHLSDAYTNVLDNDLNNTMKFLTVISILMAIPTIIFGFFGQNVDLPFSHAKSGWLATVLVAIVFTLLVGVLVKMHDFNKK
ncbi:magnesium transporter CorA family protein [Lentilactobacillus senioris]|uniref:magnesium transporter CorA family protein n=1 Tax=Lentilactobacillus senioris TaxID=931534 RepID=UPI00227DCD57|nr:magnesium transporter CorA family protein [Lentilactobacillus senioris]MCY9806520.1 magnesium transporter CorA family protein [Lentilactobacillus senioris]